MNIERMFENYYMAYQRYFSVFDSAIFCYRSMSKQREINLV